jgi:succinoglycan biosynthesis transport protein ExoP
MSPQGNRPAALDVPRIVEPSTANPRSTHAGKGPNTEQAFLQLDLMRSLQLHRRLAMSFAAVGLVLGLIYYFVKAPVYLAQCLVYVQPAPPSVIQQGFSSRWPYDASTYDSYIQQQVGNAMREDVLTSALKKLGDGARKPNESDEDALNGLRRELSVARVGQTYQFTIEARASSPELAAQTANAVAASYLESTAHDQKAGDQQRLTMLREERDRVQSALDADRSEQQELNKQLGVASIAGAPDQFDQDITEIRTELVKARTEHDAAEAKFAAMGASHGASSNAIDAAADESADTDAGLISMKTALNTRKAVLISKMANLTPGNPEYKQDAAELAQINGNLEQMMKDLRSRASSHIQLQLRSELERTAGVEAQLNSQLRQLVSSATNATSKLQRANDLAADITRLQSRFSAVDEQLHNRMLEDAAPSGAYISTPAEVPAHRTKSGRTRNALAIVLAGIILGLIAAVSRHKLDRRIYVGSDVEGVLGFGPMVLLPDFGQVSEGAAEEHLLRLAAAIEHAHKQGNLRSYVFTGASSGTGVTTIVTRVRALLESMGRPTVYVDASGTSAEEQPGRAAAEGLQATRALVTAGGRSRQSGLSNQTANEGDSQALVLTDAAPIAVSAETEYLARFADCVIVVVESGVTTRAEIRDTAATLQRLNVGAVGFVLNRVGLDKADPAFRASVDAIEKHLQLQMGAAARRTRRTGAVVTANATGPIVKSAELTPSVPVVQSQPSPSSPPPSSPPPSNPLETNSEAAGPQATDQRPAIAPEPSWMISSGETLASNTWSDVWSPAGASAASAPAKPVETAPAAHFRDSQPAPPFEPVNRQETGSMNLPEPTAARAFAAPLAPQAEPQALRIGEPQRKVEEIADPRQPTFDPSREEQVREAVRSEPHSSESPTGPVPVVHKSLWVQREGLPVQAQPELPRGSELQTAAVAPEPSENPFPEGDPDIPWWLSDVPGQRAEQAVPLLWQGERTGKSRKEKAQLESPPVEFPRHTEPSRIADSSTPKRAGAPAQSPLSERSVGVNAFPAFQPAQVPTHLTEQEDSPARLTSRLSGLRSLLAGLGLKEVHPSTGTPDSEIVPENAHRTPQALGSVTAQESNPGSQSSTKPSSPPSQTAGRDSRGGFAQQEFLKPVASVAEYGVEDSKMEEESVVRTFQPSSELEMPTLPSRRGQYRNL